MGGSEVKLMFRSVWAGIVGQVRWAGAHVAPVLMVTLNYDHWTLQIEFWDKISRSQVILALMGKSDQVSSQLER